MIINRETAENNKNAKSSLPAAKKKLNLKLNPNQKSELRSNLKPKRRNKSQSIKNRFVENEFRILSKEY